MIAVCKAEGCKRRLEFEKPWDYALSTETLARITLRVGCPRDERECGAWTWAADELMEVRK